LNRLTLAARGWAPVAALALGALVSLTGLSGCGQSAPPPSDGRLAIENIAKWRQLYCADHGGKPPADEATFVTFIRDKLRERGDASDIAALLVSPRDGQKFAVRYGNESANLGEGAVTVYEQEGYDGKVLVAFESARSREVDAAELPSLLAARP
jgi:hypothetical protein